MPVRAFLSSIFCAALFSACADSIVVPPPSGDDVQPVLDHIASNVILRTYADLEARARDLVVAVDSFVAAPGDSLLDACRNAWRAARSPWEQSESFLFGPVATEGIDPAIDSWPVNRIDLDAVLSSPERLSRQYIDGLEGTLKGFHTIEYLLFGAGAPRTASDFTPRQCEYLQGVTQSFQGATSRLLAAWSPSGGNFAGNFLQAGSAESIYLSRTDALMELVVGMSEICDEVANGKMYDPYSQRNRSLEESQFSNNSNSDFADNIRSVRNVYLGSYSGGAQSGITMLVSARNSEVDQSIRLRLEEAIAAILQMSPSFGEAIASNRTAVEHAMTAVSRLREVLDGDLLPLVQTIGD